LQLGGGTGEGETMITKSTKKAQKDIAFLGFGNGTEEQEPIQQGRKMIFRKGGRETPGRVFLYRAGGPHSYGSGMKDRREQKKKGGKEKKAKLETASRFKKKKKKLKRVAERE